MLEYQIKSLDPSQDMSRTAIFKRLVLAAENADWAAVQKKLSDLEKDEQIQVFTNMQANYDEDIAIKLDMIRKDMLSQLDSIKVLQAQYMLLLLQANYLEVLRKQRLTLKENIDGNDITIPEMAKLFAELVLTDKDSQYLRDIGIILVTWKNTR